MLKKLTARQAYARYDMFMEAADHLDQSVTDDQAERAEIPFVQDVIREHADHWFDMAKKLEQVARSKVKK